MKNIQKGIIIFLSYWFALTVLPGMVNNTNQLFDLVLASLIYAVLMSVVPSFLTFFKLDTKSDVIFLLIGGTVSLVYTYLLQPGILGLIYFPPMVNFSSEKVIGNILTLEIPQFGIIVFISITAIIFSLFLTKKVK